MATIQSEILLARAIAAEESGNEKAAELLFFMALDWEFVSGLKLGASGERRAPSDIHPATTPQTPSPTRHSG
jgi:hypothetical protein